MSPLAPRRTAAARLLAAAAAAAALLVPIARPAAAQTRPPILLEASFDGDAALGRPSALHTRLRIDTRRHSAPMTRVELLYPASLGVTTSGLGLAACRRPARDFTEVVIDGLGTLAGCPRNAVMATGSVRGEIHLDARGPVPETGTVTVLSGPLRAGRLGVVAFVDGWNPIGAKLAYAGEIAPAPAPYGGALTLDVVPLPPMWGAVVAVTDLAITIGADDIVYHERVGGRTVRYRPEGVLLPDRCPRGGFRFAVRLLFADGTRADVGTAASCPTRRR